MSPSELLGELQRLREQGLITEDEFAEKRREILAGITLDHGQAPLPSPRTALQVQSPTAAQIGAVAPRAAKDRSLALILEIVLGLFGILGVGWIYAGNTSVGVSVLLGYVLLLILGGAASVVTGGALACCVAPALLIAVGLSANRLRHYTQEHPEVFGPP